MSDPNQVQNSGDMECESVHTEGTNITDSESNATSAGPAMNQQYINGEASPIVEKMVQNDNDRNLAEAYQAHEGEDASGKESQSPTKTPKKTRKTWEETVVEAKKTLSGVPVIELETCEIIAKYYDGLYPKTTTGKKGKITKDPQKIQHLRRDVNYWHMELVSGHEWDDKKRAKKGVPSITSVLSEKRCVAYLVSLRGILLESKRSNSTPSNSQEDGEDCDQSNVSDITYDDDVPPDESGTIEEVRDKMEMRAKLRRLICDAIHNGHEGRDDIVSVLSTQYEHCYIVETLDDEKKKDQDERMWEFDEDDETYYLCKKTADPLYDERGDGSSDGIDDTRTPEQKLFDNYLLEHFKLMMDEKEGESFFDSYRIKIAQKRMIQSGKTERLQYIEHIKHLSTKLAKMEDSFEDLQVTCGDMSVLLTEKDKEIRKFKRAQEKLKSDKPMSRALYATYLKEHNFLLPGDEKDVFHIIAHANGGADHPDNYLFALGSSYNRCIGDQFDDLNCFLAGEKQAVKAIKRSMEMGNAADRRGNKEPKKYVLKYGATAEEEAKYFVKKGQDLFRRLRAERRDEMRREKEGGP
jgi:hypothetical protein